MRSMSLDVSAWYSNVPDSEGASDVAALSANDTGGVLKGEPETRSKPYPLPPTTRRLCCWWWREPTACTRRAGGRAEALSVDRQGIDTAKDD